VFITKQNMLINSNTPWVHFNFSRYLYIMLRVSACTEAILRHINTNTLQSL